MESILSDNTTGCLDTMDPDNTTSCLDTTDPVYWTVIYTSLTIKTIIFIVVLTGNIPIIITILTTDSLQTVSNYCVLNLFIADVINTCVVPGLAFVLPVTCSPPVVFRIFLLIAHMPTATSGFSMILIAVDRFIAISYPLEYPTKMTISTVRKSIILTWSVPIAVFGSGFWFFTTQSNPSTASQENMELYLFILETTFSFIILSIMTSVYTKIFLIVKTQRQKIKESQTVPQHGGTVHGSANDPDALQIQHEQSKQKEREEKKANRANTILVLLLVGYNIFWSPYTVLRSLIYMFKITFPETISIYVADLLWSVGCINTVMNTLIYALLQHDHTKTYAKLLKCDRK